jgi:hypothetical protein
MGTKTMLLLVRTAYGWQANNPCTLSASRSARKLVSASACRSLCALISLRRIGSYVEDVTVTGNPSGHGTGVVTKGCRLATC